jgi:hypothetical protein
MNCLSNGSVCGYSLPIKYAEGNRDYKDKYEKHTRPLGGYLGAHSWTGSGEYPQDRAAVLDSGSVFYDPSHNSLVLIAPVQSGSSAHVSCSGVNTAAEQVLLPILPKIQKLHHYYIGSGVPLQEIAEGPLDIHLPTPTDPRFSIYQSGKLICTFDPAAASGLKIFS